MRRCWRFLRAQAEGARYVTSVCTGSLVLGAAGLCRPRAACHWASRDLSQFGAIRRRTRRADGNIITGGGVTAGIDFALLPRSADALAGREVAE